MPTQYSRPDVRLFTKTIARGKSICWLTRSSPMRRSRIRWSVSFYFGFRIAFGSEDGLQNLTATLLLYDATPHRLDSWNLFEDLAHPALDLPTNRRHRFGVPPVMLVRG